MRPADRGEYMCGIAGFCNWKENPEENIERMKQRMLHRGPDAGGTWFSEDRSLVFGHRRLSILDLSPLGAQPMTSHSGRYTICYNGEIYNYKEVADRLLAGEKTAAFRGGSDTEVLLEALEHYGVKEGIRLCKGMFAIALYDRQEETLYLLRDRVGEKPLYYGFVGDSFVFASDIGSIVSLQGFANPVNRQVLGLYMAYGYIPAPYTIYENIYKLEPGFVLTCRKPFRAFRKEPYWSMKDVALAGEKDLFTGSEEEAAKELERLLRRAIGGQMRSDVPLGAFLSAGIDSTTIVSLMQDMSEKKVRTFTVGMEDAAYDEAVAAKEIAAHLGTEHTEIYISDQDAKAVIPGLSAMYGEPFGDSSQIPTYLVSKLTREHVTVSLSGDAGDELFCGYLSYRSADRIWNKIKGIPYPLRKAAGAAAMALPVDLGQVRTYQARLLQAKSMEDVHALSFFEELLAGQICLDQTLLPCGYSEYTRGLLQEERSNLMLMDMLMYLPDDILVKVDRAGMAVSLETRIPLLDRDVVEFAWRLPIDYKEKDGITKRVSRRILYQYVPRELVERPKKGFSIPIAKWLKEPGLKEWAQTLLDEKRIREQGFFDAAVVAKIWSDYLERDIWRPQIWYLLQFEEWWLDHAV